MNIPAFLRGGGQYRSDDEDHCIRQQHAALRQVLGELDREHRADRIGGVAEARTQAHHLRAHVQLLGDDGNQGVERRGKREIRDQREDDHGGHRGITTGEGALTHQRRPRSMDGIRAGTWVSNFDGAGNVPALTVFSRKAVRARSTIDSGSTYSDPI